MPAQNYKEIAEIALKRREAAIPPEYLLPREKLDRLPKDLTTVPRDSGHFTHDEIEIIESEAEDILQKIKEKIWTSLEVTKAFCKAAAVAQQLTNCLTEIMFPEAIALATKLDEHLERTGSVVGPLHGLPISLKDCFNVPPHPSSIGMAAYANEPATSDSVIVTMIRELGGVPYVKTNVPVAMMMMETINHIWGETINPLHTGLSAGGSSGGEGALLAMRGSPLGIGTDIGGSIRIPAAFCGLYGLKPSYGRFPQHGGRSGIPGQEFVLAVNGPMSRSLATLKLYSSALLSAAPWTHDPKCIPIPWRTDPQIQPAGRKLRLAFMPPHDGTVGAHPPVRRALAVTRAACAAAGHEIVEWAPDEHPEMCRALVEAFVGFGGSAIMQQLTPHGEPVFPHMAGYEEAAANKDNSEAIDADRIRAMNLARNDFAKRHLDRWQATGTGTSSNTATPKHPIDALIMPASPWPATRLGLTNNPDGVRRAYFGYTGVWSLLDMPACTFPVLRADRVKDVWGREGGMAGELDRVVRADYEAGFYHGAPVGLQCVGERLGEERVLEVVGVVREALEGWEGGVGEGLWR